jgi:hypothetical protein
MSADNILPIGNIPSAESNDLLTSALPVLTLGIRSSDGDTPIGYCEGITRTHTRKVEPVLQLEPYVDGTFSNGSNASATFKEQGQIHQTSTYYPGERVEVVPGPITDEKVQLSRTVLYTSTMIEALMRTHFGEAGEGVNKGQDIVSLVQQTRPFTIFEIYVSPLDGKIIWGIKYNNCFATNMPRTVKIEDTKIMEEIEFEVTNCRYYVS